MNMHKNARMTPIGRERLVQAVVGGQRPPFLDKTPKLSFDYGARAR